MLGRNSRTRELLQVGRSGVIVRPPLWCRKYIIFSSHFSLSEDMPSLKPSLPFGQLPVLEVDGDMIGQSMAIARFLANQYGIAGSSNLVKAQVDEVVDVMNDVQDAMVRPNIN